MALSTGLGRGSAARQGIALLVAAMFTITVMDAGIKWLSAGYPSFQIILFRCVFGLIPVALIVAWSGGIAALRTGRPWEQALRAVCGVGAMLSFFTALALLPLAEVTALAFAAPFFVTALSVPVLGERVGARRWGAVIVGFVGVLVIVRPGTAVFTPASVLPVFASFCFALGMVLARRLSTTDSTASIVFYTTVAGILASGTGTLFVWRTPAPLDIVWLAGIGLLGGFGQMMMTHAYKLAQAAVVAPFEYTAMPWAVLFGWAIWQEVPDTATLVGAAIVIGSSLYILHREVRVGSADHGPEAKPEP